nr:MAG TPA: AntA/AntB antirepressor [Bacteriophage sp.]
MTTELIKTTGITLNGDKITAVNARDLWKFLESKQDFSTWIKRRIEKYEFIEGQDYLLHKFVEQLPSGAKHCIEYLISLDMAKELAMVENNERGRQARQYFIEVEKRYRQTGNLVETIRAALTPIIRENEQYRARLELARNFLPNGNPGDLNRAGLPKNKFRRGCYVARNGRDISLLMENPTLPGLFEEIPVNLMNGHFGALPEPEAVYED